MKDTQNKKEPKISNQLKKIPHLPGVYKMLDEKNEVIYVGKAKDLKKRVTSYFTNSKQQSVKNIRMISQIKKVEFISVDSELEAIMLEINMIKELRPKYNILMKDDKNFVYIKVHLNEDFPRISFCRSVEKDGAKYFGPKTSGFAAKEILKLLKKIFPYRHCPLKIEYVGQEHNDGTFKAKVKGNFKHPCIDYHIKRCPGPCIGKGTKEQYQDNIQQIVDFLEGKTEHVLGYIQQKMIEAAAEKKFEIAAKLRDKLGQVNQILEKQKITTPTDKSVDIINYAISGKDIFTKIFQIRSGKLLNEIGFRLKVNGQLPEDKEVMSRIIKGYYPHAVNIAKTIFVPVQLEDQKVIEEWIGTQAGHKVKINVPQKGDSSKLLEMVHKNAILFAEKESASFEGTDGKKGEEALKKLTEELKLKKIPKRVECYDISHLSGEMTVGSMVVFKNAYPSKSDYRIFKIKNLAEGKIDDYASLNEVLSRRLKWLTKHKSPQGITIRKPTKKDLSLIKQELKTQKLDFEGLDESENMVAKKNKDIIGFLRLKKHIEGAVEMCSLWVDPEFRGKKIGHSLMQKIIEKTKAKKIYILCSKSLENYYSSFGFVPTQKVPDFLEKKLKIVYKERCELKSEVATYLYDKNKYIKDKSFTTKPDLIIIDGGKGQLSSAKKVIDESELNIPIISIAKKNEEIFLPGIKTPINTENKSPQQFLVQRIRDEAHRFAIEFNRNLRIKKLTESSLDGIQGVGEKIKKKLLIKFGSVSNIKQSTVEEIGKVVGDKIALKIKSKLT
ncbi:excinuclease ABC subunit UvrC [Patescibacteria group bacterium]|nr:excinuclease ABC subunit UvrC [Patescibacteria group bacterium]